MKDDVTKNNEKYVKTEVNFSPRDTMSHLIRVLKVNVESIYYGLKLIESNPELPDRLENEDDFLHLQVGEPLPENDLKKHLKHILLTKLFEDLIKGLTLSLCDVYTLINFRIFFCEQPPLSPEIISEKHNKLYKESQSKNFPNLLESISDSLGKKLLYSDELLTINKARNCFVHRTGIVYQEKDINNKKDNTLTTRWVRPFLYQKNDGKEIEMANGGIVTNESPAFLKSIQKDKSFKPNERITFSYREIIEIAGTFYTFGTNLVEDQIQFLKENPVLNNTDIE